jgi:CheY-like chemotaxis protein
VGVHILLVEDDVVDMDAVRRVLRDGAGGAQVHVACDGVEALAMLRARGGAAIPAPRIVLTDLHMPRMGGLDLLRAMRQDVNLQSIQVFVLTASEEDQDRVAAANLNVAGFIRKSRFREGLRASLEQVVALLAGARTG